MRESSGARSSVQQGRVLLGLLVVVAATAWTVGGPSGVSTVVGNVASHVPWLLVAVGVAALLARLVAPGLLAGPLLVTSAGLAMIVVHTGWLAEPRGSMTFGTLAIVGGALLVMFPQPVKTIGAEGRALRSFLWPSRYVVTQAPARLTLTSVLLGSITLDLSRAEFPPANEVQIFVRVVAGRVKIVVPRDWSLVAGDLTAMHRVGLEGAVSTVAQPSEPPEAEGSQSKQEGRIALWARISRRWGSGLGRSPKEPAEPREKLAFLNVAGLLGRVEVHVSE
jgi:hypothetical protein